MEEQTAQTNRLTDLLKIYFPQALTWLDELSAPLAWAFLQRWPTLTQLQKEDPEVVRQFFYQHGSRSAQDGDARHEPGARAEAGVLTA